MKTLPLKILSVALFATLLFTPMAQANNVTMNLGFGAPEASIYGRFATLFQKHVATQTNGSVTIKIRCCNQISTEDQAFKAMQLGTVDGFVITANNISPHWPMMDVTVLPYIFQNSAHMDRVLNGEVGAFIKSQLQADTSVHLMSFGPAMYRDFYNAVRPVLSMKDMKDLKVRVPKNDVMLATFEAFGANPIPLAWSETPTALQTGTVDGGDNGTSFIRDMKFYEFEPHLVILEHFVSFSPLFASDHFMKRLSSAQREQLLKAAFLAGKDLSLQVKNETEEIRQWLVEKGGMKMTRPDKTEFIKAAQGVQKLVASQRGPQFVDLVEKITAEAQ